MITAYKLLSSVFPSKSSHVVTLSLFLSLPPPLYSLGSVESSLCVRALFARRCDEAIVNGVCRATSVTLAAILSKYSLLSCVLCVAAVVWH